MYQPVAAYPPVLVLQGLLVAAALYLPTTVMDVDADSAAGDATAAVRWSPAACRRLGVGVWAVAIAAWLACCHLGVLVIRDDWLVQVLAAPVLFAVYVVLTRRQTIAGMAVVAGTFAVPALDFLAAWV
jgi:chlorophyll synthase